MDKFVAFAGRVIGSVRELPTKPLARRRLQQFLAPINDPAYRPGRIANLVEFAERWQMEVLSQCKQSSINAANSHLCTHILPALGNLRLDQIGPEVQQAFVTRIASKVARKTLLNVLSTLSAILTKAKEWKYLCEPVSLQSLAFPANVERGNARFFTPDQVRAIITAAPQPWKTFFTLAAMTGMRPGELLGLQFGDLDFERRVIQVRRSAWYRKAQSPKTAKSVRSMPLPEPLARILEEYVRNWQPNPGGYLFVTRNKHVSERYEKLLGEPRA